MFARLLALAVMATCVAGCNTMHGMGQDFNSVFAPSKNTSDQTIFGSKTANSGSGTSTSASTSGK